MNLQFNREIRTISISNTEQVELRELYSAIRKWEANNMAEPSIVRGCGFVRISSEERTSPIVTLLGGWRISSKEKITIVGGLFRTEDKDGNYVSPVSAIDGNNVTVRN